MEPRALTKRLTIGPASATLMAAWVALVHPQASRADLRHWNHFGGEGNATTYDLCGIGTQWIAGETFYLIAQQGQLFIQISQEVEGKGAGGWAYKTKPGQKVPLTLSTGQKKVHYQATLRRLNMGVPMLEYQFDGTEEASTLVAMMSEGGAAKGELKIQYPAPPTNVVITFGAYLGGIDEDLKDFTKCVEYQTRRESR